MFLAINPTRYKTESCFANINLSKIAEYNSNMSAEDATLGEAEVFLFGDVGFDA